MVIGTAVAGLRFKNANVGTLSSVMEYIETRQEVRHLTKDEHKIVKAHAHFQNDVEKHDIEKIDKELNVVYEKGKDFSMSVYKTVVHDFLAMRRLLRLITQLKDEQKKILVEFRRVKGPFKPEEMAKQAKLIEKRIAELEGLDKGEKGRVLHRVRQVLNGLYHLCEGNMDTAFFVKSKVFIDWYLLNYMKMRYEASKIRRDVLGSKKAFDAIQKRDEHLKRVFKEVQGKLKAEEVKKLVEQEKKDIKVIEGQEDKFIELLKNAFGVILHLFSNSTLLMAKVIRIVREEEHDDIKLAQEHEIPLALAEKDKGRKAELLATMQRSLKAMFNDMNQLARAA